MLVTIYIIFSIIGVVSIASSIVYIPIVLTNTSKEVEKGLTHCVIGLIISVIVLLSITITTGGIF
jgi:hypothetical protein